MTHEQDADERVLGRTIRAVLRPFCRRVIDDALLAKMAEALNQQLTSFRGGSRIELALDGSAIRVELRPSEIAGVVGFDAVAAALAA